MKTQTQNMIGKFFNIKTNDGFLKMECIEWDSEKRVFKCDQGFIEMDWMEYADQQMLGNITTI